MSSAAVEVNSEEQSRENSSDEGQSIASFSSRQAGQPDMVIRNAEGFSQTGVELPFARLQELPLRE